MIKGVAKVCSDSTTASTRKRKREWADEEERIVTQSTKMAFEEEVKRQIVKLANQMDQEGSFNNVMQSAQRWPFGSAVRAAKIAKDCYQSNVTSTDISRICRKADPHMWMTFVTENFERLYEEYAHLSLQKTKDPMKKKNQKKKMRVDQRSFASALCPSEVCLRKT